jgi:aerotaxis receptor
MRAGKTEARRMRLNEPVTNTEIELPDNEPLVSRTDSGGRIVFANHVFVGISGFTEQELIGAPHNLVRHPHMPPEAFANLWATIKAGRPWEGLVKNRAKSGDFYWVQANVTPVVENKTVTGYISIRSKPSRERVRAAEQAYASIRAGSARRIGLADGELVKTGAWTWLSELSHSMFGRLAAVAIAALLAMLFIGWLGFSGMAASNASLRHVYEHDLMAVNQLRTISDRLRDSRNLIAQMTIALGRGTPSAEVLSEREPPVRANLEQISALWSVYRALDLTPQQRVLAERFDHADTALRGEVIDPAFGLAKRGDIAKLNELFEKTAPPLFQAAFDADRDLVNQQIAGGQAAYQDAVESLGQRLIGGIGVGLGSMAAVFALCWALVVTVRRTTKVLEAHFEAINHGDLAAEILRPRAREFHGVTAMLRAMRAHLAYKSWESAEFERKAATVRRETVERMASTIEQETGSAVENVAARTGEMAREADAMAASAERVGGNAAHVAVAADHAMNNAQMVAAASEELVSAINEVSSQMRQSNEVAQSAAQKGADAQAIIRSLSEAGERIGAVVRLIADIASKTNLLALNATIEAARAGDAGKGFAVVAGEVKALATQTAKATGEISQQIDSLRSATDLAVATVEDISQTLDQMAKVTVSVTAAVEQQTAATREIARNVAESGAAVQEVTQRIAEVSADANVTGSQAAELRRSSGAVAGDIAALRSALVKTVRTATDDANRRRERRVVVDEPCTLVADAGGGRVSARLSDVSHGGAAVLAVDSRVPPSGGGTLTLDRHGGAQTRFEIRSSASDGHVHVQFDRLALNPAFKRALQSMLGDEAADPVASVG